MNNERELSEKELAVIDLNNLLKVNSNVSKVSLEYAQNYYMDIVNITSSILSKDKLSLEQLKYKALIKTHEGLPVFCDESCASFMSEKFSMDYEICFAYVKSGNGF